MAGLGIKNFGTEVLASSDVDQYLMQQSVMVFASEAARTSAFSIQGITPSIGMVSFLSDTQSTQYYNGVAWVGYAVANSLSNHIVAANCERNGPPGVSAFYAFGNGAQGTNISLPLAGKLVAATFTASTDINGTITVRPVINAVVQSVTYELSVTAATQRVTGNYLSAPLNIPAGLRFGWQCQSQTATVGSTVIYFIMRFD